MSHARNQPIWLLSFIDLCLVLLGFFVMLHAMTGSKRELVKGLRDSFGSHGSAPEIRRHHLVANALFQPGEALFRAGQFEALQKMGAEAAVKGAHVRIESFGTDPATNRFDGWELAAARTAAAARAVQSGGLAATAIEIAIPGMTGASGKGRQRLEIEIAPPKAKSAQ